MSRFNGKTVNKTENLAGGKAFKMDKRMELIHAVLTTFLENKFYESGDDRLLRIQKLVAANKPEFVANLAIIARLEFNLRSVSHALIGELAKIHKGDDLIKRTMVKACIRPDDLTEIAAYVGRPLPKQIKRGVRNALLKFNRYQLSKYRGENKDMSMVDLFNLCHPKVKHANLEQKKAWDDLINGKLNSFDTWETEISASKPEERKAKWEALIKEGKLGYMALIRNLNNLVKYKVDEATIDLAVAKLTNEEEVKKSKQLPFRFTTAYKNVEGNRKFSDAISYAMDLSVQNTPILPGKTLIAIDSSGSMSGDPMEKASIFGATLAKSNPNSDIILYDTNVKVLKVSSRTPVIDIAKEIEREAMGGGTQTSLVFAYAIQEKEINNKIYDRIIIISDNESWSEGWGGSVQEYYNQYKSVADPFVYAIDIQGYGTKDVTGSKVFHLTGWSNRLLDFVGRMEEGQSLVDYVTNYATEKTE